MTDTTPPEPSDHPRRGAPARERPAASQPDLRRKALSRAALRRQIDENLRAAFGAVLDEPCPDHLSHLLCRLAATGQGEGAGSGAAGPVAGGGTGTDAGGDPP